MVALYCIKELVKRVKQIKPGFKEDDGFGTTNRSSLLNDMDDEWRMQKIENQTPQQRRPG